MNIGFIGLGVMGSRMAKRIMQRSEYDLIVYNRTPEKVIPFLNEGAKAVHDIPSLATCADVICTCLSMPNDVMQVYAGEGGILDHIRPGTICIDFTTVGIDTSLEIAALAKEKGAYYLDAPVSGGPEGVEQGTLTIMVGGDEACYKQVQPILGLLGSNVHHLGPTGQGSVAKLMNQYLVAVHSLAASEVMVAGTSLGLKPDQLFAILRASYGDSRMLRRHMENHVLERNFQPGGAAKYLLKDLRLANQLFDRASLEPRTGKSAEQVLHTAVEQGLGELDMSVVIQPLEKESRVVVKGSTSR